MNLTLYIDTTQDESVLRLCNPEGGVVDELLWLGRCNQSEELLQKIDFLIKRNGSSKEDISKIIVNRGPGSYTGLRVGVTTANFLAYSLDIPVVGLTLSEIKQLAGTEKNRDKNFVRPVIPFYERPPHITVSKKSITRKDGHGIN